MGKEDECSRSRRQATDGREAVLDMRRRAEKVKKKADGTCKPGRDLETVVKSNISGQLNPDEIELSRDSMIVYGIGDCG